MCALTVALSEPEHRDLYRYAKRELLRHALLTTVHDPADTRVPARPDGGDATADLLGCGRFCGALFRSRERSNEDGGAEVVLDELAASWARRHLAGLRTALDARRGTQAANGHARADAWAAWLLQGVVGQLGG